MVLVMDFHRICPSSNPQFPIVRPLMNIHQSLSDYELAYHSFWGYSKEGQRLVAYPGPIVPIRAQRE